MLFMPFQILGIWLSGLFSFALIGAGAFLVREWYRHGWVLQRFVEGGVVYERLVFAWRPGFNEATAYLAAGLALLVWAFAGRLVLGAIYPLLYRTGVDEPEDLRTGEVERLRRPDGTELRVESYGPADAPPIVLTHGWGANSAEWYYAKKYLADRFRLIVWDLPGLGLSRKPDTNDYSLEKLARDLDAVLALAGDRPAILLGHSIGGMITLTFCRLFPEALGRRVAGLALVHTTYTNPARTARWSGLYTALQKPVIEPLLHLTIGLWPLVWLWQWLSYLNGSTHASTARQVFAGTETRGQLDFAARFTPHAPPQVYARGMFGMLRYDATATLPTIGVPTLVVAADRDTTTRTDASERIARDVPTAELFTLAPAKHMGLIEHYRPFLDKVASFATACAGSEVGGRSAV
jgi:pimeloyl-ACP methyl ester carboxylesterase